MGLAVLGPLLTAQDATAYRARLAGEPAVAVRALAEVPEALAAAIALDVVELLRNTDTGVRNAAIVWLRGHPGLADAVIGRVTELRRDGDVDTARAAGAVYRVMLAHRSVSLDELREQLRDPSRRSVALEALQKSPETAFVLLPELLQMRLYSSADPLLGKLIELDSARVETAIAAAIDAGGDADWLIAYLERASADLRRHAQRLDAWRPAMGSHRTGAAIVALTRLVVAGLPPPPNWLEVLRRDDPFFSRQRLLGELGRHAVPAALWPELLPLLGDRQAVHQVAPMLLAEGRRALTNVDAVRAALVRATPETIGSLADLAAQLAPATRDCATLLLPHLAIEHAPTRQGLLLALGELGDASPQIVAAIENLIGSDDEGVRRAAVVALRQLGVATPAGVESAATEQLLQDVAGAPWDRALLAEFELAARGVSPYAVWGSAVQRPTAREWLPSRAQRGLLSDLLRRMADAPCRDAEQVAVLEGGRWLSVQDEVRRLDVLARSGDPGHRKLGDWLYSRQDPRRVLDAITAVGGEARDLQPEVEPFAHHPELAVREAAETCLRAIGGEEAVSRARGLAGPWARYLEVAASNNPTEVLVFATDQAQPQRMRAQILSRLPGMIRTLIPEQKRTLLGLLEERDPQLRRIAVLACLSDPAVVRVGRRRDVFDLRVLRAFAGGARDVREPIGFMVRASLGVALPPARFGAMSPQQVATNLPDANSLTQLALEAMRTRDGSTALLQAMLATNHAMTDVVLRAQGENVSEALVPQLVERLTRRGVDIEVLARCLLQFPEGQAAMIRHAPQLPAERRMALLAAAGAGMFEHRATIAAQLRVAVAQPQGALVLAGVAELPWRTRAAELTEIAELVRLLWLQGPARRAQLLPLIGAMGPAAEFATDDLAGMLRGDGTEARLAADALLANGHAEPVKAWLRELVSKPAPRPALAPALQIAMGDVVAELAAEAADDQIAQLFAHVSDQHLSMRARTDLDLRLLALAEAQGLPALERIGWLRGKLDPAAEPAFAAFLKRRAANGGFADSLQQRVAGHLFASYPRLCLDAVRDGLVAGGVVINRCADLRDVGRIAAVGDQVLEFAARDHHTGAGEAIGEMLARLPNPPVAKVVGLLGDASTQHLALRVLLGLGPKGAPALDAVEAIVASRDDGVRFLAAKILTAIGPAGITRLGELVRQSPELVGALDAVLASGDAASVGSVASVLLSLPPGEPNEARANAIRGAIARLSDHKVRALLTLALLRFANEGLDRDWLGVAGIEPAVVRRRAITGLSGGALTLLQLGALVELLDDLDPGVRTAAATALLADPTRVAACRLPLEEYAQRQDLDPAEAAAVRKALAK
ncbi:MAG: hypothetical protein KDC48_02435 [Planctomycetes bacterium]|nr:hypothetical protein [Planctomycetota bacterium]